MDQAGKIKVAIIGGGCGALTAAFDLTRPELSQRFDVTVYQMGWRLGGKGASGRDRANRIEEHGLHVWMGWYENAFRLIRDCYAELDSWYKDPEHAQERRQSRFKDWQDAFLADPWVGVADESRGAWRVWCSHLPSTPGLPGDPLDAETNPFTLGNYLARSIDLLRALTYSTFVGSEQKPADVRSHQLLDFAEVSPRAIVNKITSLLRTGVIAGAGALYEAMAVLQVLLSERFSLPQGDYKVLEFADAISASIKKQAGDLATVDESLRPKLELIELVVTIIVGILRDQLLSEPRGLDAINDEDCRVWLRRHGASERACNSSLVRALYQMAFADQKVSADDDTRGLAAGQALRGALRMFFTYRGSLFWKMRAGMGDSVFSPLYEVLKNRGVKFRFFHRLARVGLAPAKAGEAPHIAQLTFDVQAKLEERAKPDWSTSSPTRLHLWNKAKRDKEYYPLDEHGLWPSKAFQSQLADETPEQVDFESPFEPFRHEQLTLDVTTDFDFVVLGISVGAIPLCCQELIATDARWRAMVAHSRTAATQGLQLWTSQGLEALSPAPGPGTFAGFQPPFDTWSDMTHVLPEESRSSLSSANEPRARGLVYFCGTLPDPDVDSTVPGSASATASPTPKFKPEDIDAARERAIEYLDRTLPLLWRNLQHEKTREFRWELLLSDGDNPVNYGGNGTERLAPAKKRLLLDSQYFRANVHPSDRYVLSRPSTLHYRISPLDNTYDNLTIAGDWTDCGFNEGCVEAAVMSGRLAAHALSCYPPLEDIIGYDHP